jgi:hypothetical protein
MPANLDSLAIALTFIVPGFVLLSTLRALLPRRPTTGSDLIISCLTASSLNYAAWFWLVYYLTASGFGKAHPLWTGLLWTVVTLSSPILLGVFLAHFDQRQYVGKVLHLLGFNPLHPIPAAWDFKFYNTSPVWVLVTLKDGGSVAGFWGSRSFASSDPAERDLYIETVYMIPRGKKPWQKIPRSAGMLIPGREIRHIEFWSDDKEETHNA